MSRDTPSERNFKFTPAKRLNKTFSSSWKYWFFFCKCTVVFGIVVVCNEKDNFKLHTCNKGSIKRLSANQVIVSSSSLEILLEF